MVHRYIARATGSWRLCGALQGVCTRYRGGFCLDNLPLAAREAPWSLGEKTCISPHGWYTVINLLRRVFFVLMVLMAKKWCSKGQPMPMAVHMQLFYNEIIVSFTTHM